MTAGGATLSVSCAEKPNYATTYFDTTPYFVEGVSISYEADYAGYFTSGYEYDSNVCFTVIGQQGFCTTTPSRFYGADTIISNNWNAFENAATGTVGFGRLSPMWDILGLDTAN